MKFGITLIQKPAPQISSYQTSNGKEFLAQLDAMKEESEHILKSLNPCWQDQRMVEALILGASIGTALSGQKWLSTIDTYRAALLMALLDGHEIEGHGTDEIRAIKEQIPKHVDLPIQEFIKRRAQYWLIMEDDLAAAVIGPFQSFDAVTEHIAFCKVRGDGAAVLGVFDSVFDVETIIKDRLGRGYIRLTPTASYFFMSSQRQKKTAKDPTTGK
jgi:hypothetical protein